MLKRQIAPLQQRIERSKYITFGVPGIPSARPQRPPVHHLPLSRATAKKPGAAHGIVAPYGDVPRGELFAR